MYSNLQIDRFWRILNLYSGSGLMAVARPDLLSVAGGCGCGETAVERDVAGSVCVVVQLEDFVGAERLEARADRRWQTATRASLTTPP
jgi:hypothetical protein